MGRIVIVALLLGVFATGTAVAAPADPDGRYRGTHVKGGQKLTQKISFRVSGGGRWITRLRTTASTFCVGPTLFDNRIFIAPVYVARIRMAPNGRFDGDIRPGAGTKLKVTGRRRGRRVAGRIELRIANCSGGGHFVARRVGP